MAIKLSAEYGVNRESAENGKWFEMGEWRIKLRRLQSKASQKARAEAERPFARAIQMNKLTDGQRIHLLHEQLAHGVVVDWEGILDDDDKPLKYDPQRAIKLFEQYEDLVIDIVNLSKEMDGFKDETKEVVVKN